jgi:adenosylcobinamide-phosphate synthase
MNWIPARWTACCMLMFSLIVPRAKTLNGWKIMRRDARKHPSPNSGWTEAAVAGMLGVQLGGRNVYQGIISERARLGDRLRELQPLDILDAVMYMHGGWIVFMMVAGTIFQFVEVLYRVLL